jgi:predicted Zn-dependent peptidase
MQEFREKYYTPDNCALIVSGDVESESVFSASAAAMGPWQYGGASDYQSLEPFARVDRDTTVHLDSPSGITYVSIVFPGPPLAVDPRSTYAADVWGSYLDLMSREFYADLVTNGPFTSVSAGYYTQRCDPVITFGGMVRDGMAREAVRALQSEIWQLCDSSYYDPAGLDLAAEMIRRHRLLGEETAYDVAVESLAFWWIEWGSLDYYSTYLDMIDRVGVADIARFLDRYVDRRPCAVFVMEPAG